MQIVTVEELIQDCDDLPTLPDVYLRVKEVVDNPKASMVDLARALSVDPAMTARVLKLVNSPFYGISGKVETVSRAVSLLGMQPVHDLVLATAVATTFSEIQAPMMDMKLFWRASVERGLFARVIAKTYNLVDSERLFVGGLLSDIGHLVMFQKIPELSEQAFCRAKREGTLRTTIEKTMIGFDSADVGAELLKAWDLPLNYQHGTRYHLDPLKAPEPSLEIGILYVAAIVAECQMLDLSRENWMESMRAAVSDVHELTDEDLSRFLVFVQEGLTMTLEMMFPSMNHAA